MSKRPASVLSVTEEHAEDVATLRKKLEDAQKDIRIDTQIANRNREQLGFGTPTTSTQAAKQVNYFQIVLCLQTQGMAGRGAFESLWLSVGCDRSQSKGDAIHNADIRAVRMRWKTLRTRISTQASFGLNRSFRLDEKLHGEALASGDATRHRKDQRVIYSYSSTILTLTTF